MVRETPPPPGVEASGRGAPARRPAPDRLTGTRERTPCVGIPTSLNGVHAIGSRRHDQAMFGTSHARKTQQRGPFALQIFYTTPLNYPEAARYAPIRSE